VNLLKINGLSRNFGGLRAVHDVSFSVQSGSIKALIGPNGAGKTTLFNLISGFLKADSGSVYFNSIPVHGLKPFQITGRGMARTFQHIKLFPHMTALETVMMGRHIHSRSGFLSGMLSLPWTWAEDRKVRARSLEIMDFLGISEFAEFEATSLPYGQQRIVELARALACEPELLLLDEPAAGLNMRETDNMADLITRIKNTGVTVLIVEHDMSLVMNISDEIVVLSYGEKIADDEPAAIQNNREVIRVYLGEDDA
jgi:branched-chain amino acid transport system ATP-binding protein